jgi:hypothetical protein
MARFFCFLTRFETCHNFTEATRTGISALIAGSASPQPRAASGSENFHPLI